MLIAIKTLEKPYKVDPLARHDFDSFIVESFLRQRNVLMHKKSNVSLKTMFGQENLETPKNSIKIGEPSKQNIQEKVKGVSRT